MLFKKPIFWCYGFIIMTVLLLASIVASNYYLDFYGIYGDSKGRELRIYTNDRLSKYLLSFNYIPSNFDGLLIGSSATESYDLTKIDNVRIYNVAVSAGTATEQKIIADNVFSVAPMKIVIFSMNPYLTHRHGTLTNSMLPREKWRALFSTQALITQAGALIYSLFGKGKWSTTDAWGKKRLPIDSNPENKWPNLNFSVYLRTNEDAFDEYENLIKTARLQGARVIGFNPPMYSKKYQLGKDLYDSYIRRASSIFMPNEQIIDFMASKYDTYNNNSLYFTDGYHLSSVGVEFFSSELVKAINESN
jgi:hypothetical protein